MHKLRYKKNGLVRKINGISDSILLLYLIAMVICLIVKAFLSIFELSEGILGIVNYLFGSFALILIGIAIGYIFTIILINMFKTDNREIMWIKKINAVVLIVVVLVFISYTLVIAGMNMTRKVGLDILNISETETIQTQKYEVIYRPGTKFAKSRLEVVDTNGEKYNFLISSFTRRKLQKNTINKEIEITYLPRSNIIMDISYD